MKGWSVNKIGDVCTLATGGTPSKSKPEYFGGNIKWLVSGDIHQQEIFDCEGRITEAGMRNSNAKLLPVNSVMIALNGQGKTRGSVALLRSQATCNQSLVCISPKSPAQQLLPEFLYAYLYGRYQEIRCMTGDSGNDRRGLNMGLISSIGIPIAPLPEQKRIVGILDEAFEGIATAKTNAEKNLQNARAIFDSHLQSVFTQRGEGWLEKTLGELGTITSSKRIFKSEYVKSGVPFYRTKEIKELANGREITTELFISEARYKKIKASFDVPKQGDILLTAIGTIGEIYVVEGDYDFYFKDGNVLWLNGFTSINPYFLKYVLVSFVVSLNKMAHGSAYNALPIQRLNTHRIFVPSPAEQTAIVSRLDSLREETQRLVSLYQRKLAALEALKKSLLHQAFGGQL